MAKNKRTAFFISDGTGLTVEAIGHSLLAQFRDQQVEQVTLPYVDSPEKVEQVLTRIEKAAQESGLQPIVISSIVSDRIRERLHRSSALMLDVFESYLTPLANLFGSDPAQSVNISHGIDNDRRYSERIDAVHFAMDNDDGRRVREFERADVILVGVSRSGKTPTCIYLALQFGLRAANYPITEEDMDSTALPKILRPYRHKLFGLTIDPERLMQIRQERRANSRYASLEQCEFEVRQVEQMLRRAQVPYLDATQLSVEELATRLMSQAGIERRIG
ncbi:posphoenolpyruvate synthetase regulatory kinase/phosphorylase PpsR [Microbulbifer thermotolerans]|uniref:Putative phosphoenolpyruvate synthase regulatory protein n=1 Tax=Microbulbifer thermotolerans TaxID=252514 RepID=A0A143HLE8_MICTH|nr:pyruvate, water dikinase regulatory protein [Microbulbifer thermotolerans]AMX02518.1 phosphoenolpyruvate synthase regulatory protein [Microbulbifer thermotolerans]MCX2779374.1 kinase/pyrophosphorylase [Microbulbifer thermotolerans]MCX2782422.1 kinase/pyrophosphorylase [Microbulbifer thermotolerans]MCX2795007.1 kinase/pyrophosphorylase [Microbulbifer thermotolerans]MCX2800575.1 kinase/pyrophosphorylase [Microbulbifer thermotolerans]